MPEHVTSRMWKGWPSGRDGGRVAARDVGRIGPRELRRKQGTRRDRRHGQPREADRRAHPRPSLRARASGPPAGESSIRRRVDPMPGGTLPRGRLGTGRPLVGIVLDSCATARSADVTPIRRQPAAAGGAAAGMAWRGRAHRTIGCPGQNAIACARLESSAEADRSRWPQPHDTHGPPPRWSRRPWPPLRCRSCSGPPCERTRKAG
jgi:hypothetical protein